MPVQDYLRYVLAVSAVIVGVYFVLFLLPDHLRPSSFLVNFKASIWAEDEFSSSNQTWTQENFTVHVAPGRDTSFLGYLTVKHFEEEFDELTGIFTVHYALLYGARQPAAISFMECLSVLSVMLNLQPVRIIIHTDRPKFWPFETCKDYITDWSAVTLRKVALKGTFAGKQFKNIEHEADLLKMEVIARHGGLAMDFDVYIINGTRISEFLAQYPCIVSKDAGDYLNAGFLACNQNATYPWLILESYEKDFQPGIWTYNSGKLPFRVFRENNHTAYMETEIAMQPSYYSRASFLDNCGNFNWKGKMAHHSFYHDRQFDVKALQKKRSNFSDLLSWLLKQSGNYNGDLSPPCFNQTVL